MKTCGKCGQVREAFEFWKCGTTADGLQKQCKDCQRAAQRDRAKTPAHKARQRTWVASNQDRVKASRNAWAAKHIDRIYEWQKAHPDEMRAIKRRQTERLTDTYVKRRIARDHFSMSIVPPAMVEAKRQQLRIQRQLKELK